MRTIHADARAEVLEFLSSALCRRLEERGEIVTSTPQYEGAELRLLHPRVAVPTYPWEWTASQWAEAAERTLALCEVALGEGWILKDATPLNILFVGSRPVLVDVLSFERWDGANLWLAYGQYVRTFVLTLLMHRMLRWPLALSLFRRDGYEPTELYDALRWPQRLSRTALWTITIPAWLERRNPEARVRRLAPAKDRGLALHVLRRSLASLRRQTQRSMPASAHSDWSRYEATRSHYSAAESGTKLAWMRDVLSAYKPACVLDVGANTGEFSALAVECGAHVIALERDAAAADRLFAMSRAKGLDILTIHGDLARPTPAAGWANAEHTSLLARLQGAADMVLLLAVIHHLLLIEQIPLDRIVALLHGLARRHLVVEWVPVSDPMYQSLMRGREALYGSLTERDLLAACAGRFALLQRQVLENGRVLLLFERVA